MKYIHDGLKFVMFTAVDGSHADMASRTSNLMNPIEHAGFVSFGSTKGSFSIWGSSISLKKASKEFDLSDEIFAAANPEIFNSIILSNDKIILEHLGFNDSNIFKAEWVKSDEVMFDSDIYYLGPPANQVLPRIASHINAS